MVISAKRNVLYMVWNTKIEGNGYKKEIPLFLCYFQVVMAELRHLFLIICV